MSDLPKNWPADWVPPKVTVMDMLSALRIESVDIVRRQKSLVEGKVIQRPDEGMLRRALALHRAEGFILKCSPYTREILEVVERLQRKGPR